MMAPPSISLEGKMSTLRHYVIIRETGRDMMAAVLKMYLDEYGTRYTTLYEHHGPRGYQFNQLCDKDKLDDKDITYLNEKLWYFYNDKIITGELQRLLRTITNKRNDALHNKKDFTPRTLANELKAFHNKILNEIMCLTQNMFSRRHRTTIDNLRMKVDNDFKDILEKVREKYDPSNPEDIRRYKEELRDFGTQFPEFVRVKSRKIFKTVYKTQCQTRVLDWLSRSSNTDPSKVSVSLTADRQNEFHLGQFPSKEIDQTEILDVKQPNGDEADVAIISGEAGAGKTTLLCLILELWSKGETENFPKLSDYDILIYIQLRDRNYDSLDAYIEHILKDVVEDFGLSIVKSSLLNSRCLFLLDGYDEINEKSKPLLEEILKLSQTKKIVVTTRPINTKLLTDKVDDQQNKRVNLSFLGMTKESVLQSITKLVNHHVTDEDERIQMIQKLTDGFHSMPPAMQQLRKTPLYNNLIIMLSMETRECKIFDTVTRLYEEITNRSLERLLKKIGRQEEVKVHKFYKAYSHRSLKNLLCNKLELDKEDIEFFETECERLELPFGDVMSAFFNTKNKLSSIDLKLTFCYRHTTEQEFAAAHGICDVLKEHNLDTHETEENIISHYLKKEFTQEYHEYEKHRNLTDVYGEMAENEPPRLDNVFPFLAGILVNSKLDDERLLNCLIKLVTSVAIDQYLCILSESIGSNNVIKAIVRSLSDEGGDVWKVYDGRNLSYLRPLLLKIQPEKIELSIFNDPTTFPDLKPALEAISSHGIVLHLCLYHHYWNTSRYSDEYFEVAKKLKGFLGSLSSKMFPLIKDELKFLYLRVEEKHLTQQSAKNLLELGLLIPYEENTGGDHPLCPLLFDGNKLSIDIDFEGGGGGEGKSCARKLNQLWPRLPPREEFPPPKKPKLSLKESEGDELRCGRNDMIQIKNSSFSKDDIEDFINTLQLKKVAYIGIHTKADISEENFQHLKTLDKRKECAINICIYLVNGYRLVLLERMPFGCGDM